VDGRTEASKEGGKEDFKRFREGGLEVRKEDKEGRSREVQN